MDEKIVVNKNKSQERIDALAKDIEERAKREAECGFTSFQIILYGTSSECYGAIDQVEKFGISVAERGFESFGLGSDSFCRIKFVIQ